MKSDGAQPSTEDHDALEKDGAMEAEEKARSGSSNESEASHTQSLAYGASEAAEEAQRPQIKFSDQVKRSDVMADEHIHMPVHRSTEEYIAFHERQLNRDDSAVLRIPGPRDADAGVAPPAVDESDPAVRTNSRRESAFSHAPDHVERLNGDDHIDSVTPRRNIAIAEPARPPAVEHVAEDTTAVKHSLGSLRYRAPRWLGGNKKPHEDENQLHPTKSRLARTPCKHEYCRDCIQGLFQASLTDDTLFPPRCCKQPITFGGGVRIRSFESKLIEFDTPDRTYCSNQLCSAFIRVENILEEKATCPECSTITCTVCKSESHLGTVLQMLYSRFASQISCRLQKTQTPHYWNLEICGVDSTPMTRLATSRIHFSPTYLQLHNQLQIPSQPKALIEILLQYQLPRMLSVVVVLHYPP